MKGFPRVRKSSSQTRSPLSAGMRTTNPRTARIRQRIHSLPSKARARARRPGAPGKADLSVVFTCGLKVKERKKTELLPLSERFTYRARGAGLNFSYGRRVT